MNPSVLNSLASGNPIRKLYQPPMLFIENPMGSAYLVK